MRQAPAALFFLSLYMFYLQFNVFKLNLYINNCMFSVRLQTHAADFKRQISFVSGKHTFSRTIAW